MVAQRRRERALTMAPPFGMVVVCQVEEGRIAALWTFDGA